jgi:ATP/ADP translocase
VDRCGHAQTERLREDDWATRAWQIHGARSKRDPIVSSMKAVLAVVAAVIAVIIVLKVIAAVSALVLAFVPAIIALGGGYAVGQIHGARRERRKLEAKRDGQLPN